MRRRAKAEDSGGSGKPDGEVSTGGRVHDYTALKWHHNITWTVELDGAVLYATGWGNGIEPGDFLLLANGDRTTRYRVAEIIYYRDPPDMWNARLEFAPRTAEMPERAR